MAEKRTFPLKRGPMDPVPARKNSIFLCPDCRERWHFVGNKKIKEEKLGPGPVFGLPLVKCLDCRGSVTLDAIIAEYNKGLDDDLRLRRKERKPAKFSDLPQCRRTIGGTINPEGTL